MTRVSRYGACFALTSALIISVSAEAQVKTTVQREAGGPRRKT